MRIVMIGSGHVGGTLGRRWAERGHDVSFGGRDEDALRAMVRDAHVVVLGTPFEALAGLAATLAPLMDGKILVDATNPIGPGLTLQSGPKGESGGERAQELMPTAHVVKAFNTTGFENMADPVYDGAATAMFVAGDHAQSKATVMELARALGFDAIDAGPLSRSRSLEHLAILWIGMAISGKDRDFALRVVRRQGTS